MEALDMSEQQPAPGGGPGISTNPGDGGNVLYPG